MGKYKVGDRVILGRHRPLSDGRTAEWGQYMDEYVGKVATIVGLRTTRNGEAAVYVDLDDRRYYWYEYCLKYAVEKPDQKCSECGVSAPHDECNGDKYTCVFCAASKELDV